MQQVNGPSATTLPLARDEGNLTQPPSKDDAVQTKSELGIRYDLKRSNSVGTRPSRDSPPLFPPTKTIVLQHASDADSDNAGTHDNKSSGKSKKEAITDAAYIDMRVKTRQTEFMESPKETLLSTVAKCLTGVSGILTIAGILTVNPALVGVALVIGAGAFLLRMRRNHKLKQIEKKERNAARAEATPKKAALNNQKRARSASQGL